MDYEKYRYGNSADKDEQAAAPRVVNAYEVAHLLVRLAIAQGWHPAQSDITGDCLTIVFVRPNPAQ